MALMRRALDIIHTTVPHTPRPILRNKTANAPRGKEHEAVRDDEVEEARLLHAALLAGRHDQLHHRLALPCHISCHGMAPVGGGSWCAGVLGLVR